MNKLLDEILPLLRLLGIDPKAQLDQLERKPFTQRMAKAVPKISADLRKHNLTPALVTDPAVKRHLIRSVMYQSLKPCWPFPIGANHAADFVRDNHAANVLREVSGDIEPTDSVEIAVQAVQIATIEDIF